MIKEDVSILHASAFHTSDSLTGICEKGRSDHTAYDADKKIDQHDNHTSILAEDFDPVDKSIFFCMHGVHAEHTPIIYRPSPLCNQRFVKQMIYFLLHKIGVKSDM